MAVSPRPHIFGPYGRTSTPFAAGIHNAVQARKAISGAFGWSIGVNSFGTSFMPAFLGIISTPRPTATCDTVLGIICDGEGIEGKHTCRSRCILMTRSLTDGTHLISGSCPVWTPWQDDFSCRERMLAYVRATPYIHDNSAPTSTSTDLGSSGLPANSHANLSHVSDFDILAQVAVLSGTPAAHLAPRLARPHSPSPRRKRPAQVRSGHGAAPTYGGPPRQRYPWERCGLSTG